MKYDTLVVSGGAIKGLLSLGALQCYDEARKLDDIDTFAGTSIGSVICLLLCLGYTPMHILICACKEDITRDFRGVDITNMFSEFGVVEPITLFNVLESMILNKMGKIPTFKELYVCTEKNLVMCTYNLTKKRLEYLSHDTHPNMCVMEAVRLSCNIPFLFPRLEYEGCLYIDGGIADDFPVNHMDDGDRIILGIYTPYSDKMGDRVSLSDYIYDVIHAPIKEIRKLRNDQLSDNVDVITLISEVKTLQFDIGLKEKQDRFYDGYRQAKKYLDRKVE